MNRSKDGDNKGEHMTDKISNISNLNEWIDIDRMNDIMSVYPNPKLSYDHERSDDYYITHCLENLKFWSYQTIDAEAKTFICLHCKKSHPINELTVTDRVGEE